DHDAVELGITHAPAAPQIAVDVAAHAVRRARSGIDEYALVGDRGATRRDVIGQDLVVRREAQPVRPQHPLGDDAGFAGRTVNPVDIGVDLGFSLIALVIAEQA